MLGISSNMHLTNLHLNIAGNDFQQQGSLNIENTIANIQNISSLDISNNSKYDLNVTLIWPWYDLNVTLMWSLCDFQLQASLSIKIPEDKVHNVLLETSIALLWALSDL
jgi:hypothetical protein